jgi:hypothetical protein
VRDALLKAVCAYFVISDFWGQLTCTSTMRERLKVAAAGNCGGMSGSGVRRAGGGK